MPVVPSARASPLVCMHQCPRANFPCIGIGIHSPSFMCINAQSTSLAFASAFTAAFMVCAYEHLVNSPHLHVSIYAVFPHLCIPTCEVTTSLAYESVFTDPPFVHTNARAVNSSNIRIAPHTPQGVNFSNRS